MISNKFLAILTGVAAILITCIAAYFSIFGLSILFAGSKIAIIIMASTLEFGKIVLITYLYRNWKHISKIFKVYYLTGVLVLMSITSLGIYGFLNYSYTIIAKKNIIANTEIKTLESKKLLYISKMQNDSLYLTQLNTSKQSYNTRLDSLYARNNNRNIKLAEKRNDKLINDISDLTKNINIYKDSLGIYDSKIAIRNNEITSSDLGPLIFVAKLFNTDIDKVVNILILLIIFVFDPLAIMLLIGFNNLTLNQVIPVNTIKQKDPEEFELTIPGIFEDDVQAISNETTLEKLIAEKYIEMPDPPKPGIRSDGGITP